jgi:outer membrane immunogenic protein
MCEKNKNFYLLNGSRSFTMSIKNLFGATAAAVFLSAASHSFAEGGYIGGQYAQTTYEQSGTTANDADAKPAALTLLGGYKFSEHIAIEGRLGFGIGDDQFGAGDVLEMDKLVSLLGKFSLGGKVSPYVVVGFTDATISSPTTDADLDGASFGLGVDFEVSEGLSLGLEYIHYATADIVGGGEADLSAISLGVNYNCYYLLSALS